MAYRLTGAARRQLDALLVDSVRHFGSSAARRYNMLIESVLNELGEALHLPGATAVGPGLDVSAYPLRLAKLRMPPRERVGSPPHVMLYRLAAPDTAEVVGFVHERMLLPRAAARLLRTPGDDPA